MEFEYFFQTAFEQNGFGDVGNQMQGKTYDEIMGAIDGAEHWMNTLLKALKSWEAAMKEKNQLSAQENIMYSIVTTQSNFFLYVFAIEKGDKGQPVITQQLGRFDCREYTNKLREGVRFAEPYIRAAETVATTKLIG